MQSRPFLYLLGVIFVSLCWSVGGPLSWVATKNLPAAETTFGRCFFAFLGLSPFFVIDSKRILGSLSKRARILLVCSGLCLGFHFFLFVSGVAHASLSTAVTLVAVEPVLVLAIGVIGFKEKLRFESLLAILLCILGIGIISVLPYFMTAGSEAPTNRRYGDFCAVLAVVGYAIYYGFNRAFRNYEKMLPFDGNNLRGSLGMASIIYFFAMLASGLVLMLSHANGSPYPDMPQGQTLLSLIAMGFVPTILGHTINQMVSRKAHPIWVSLMSPGETFMALIVGYVFLNQTLRTFEIAGGSFILLGVLLTVWSETKK